MAMIKVLAVIIVLQGLIPKPAAWTMQSSWKMLRAGMTEQQVQSIFGEPLEVESSPSLAVWYYQDRPVRNGDVVVDRPRRGIIVFKADSSKQYTVTRWTVPDWSRIPAVEVLLPIPQPTPEPKADIAKKPETQAPPLIMQQLKKPSTPTPIQPLQSMTKETVKQKKSDDIGSRYFVWCGVAFVAMAIVIAIAQGTKFFQ